MTSLSHPCGTTLDEHPTGAQTNSFPRQTHMIATAASHPLGPIDIPGRVQAHGLARLNRSPGSRSDETDGACGNGGNDGADERDTRGHRHLAGPSRAPVSGTRQVETFSLGSVHNGVAA